LLSVLNREPVEQPWGHLSNGPFSEENKAFGKVGPITSQILVQDFSDSYRVAVKTSWAG